MDSRDDFARDRHGSPILDRYGRPVRRRPDGGQPPRYVRNSAGGDATASPQYPPRQRQPLPPQQPPQQPQQPPHSESRVYPPIPSRRDERIAAFEGRSHRARHGRPKPVRRKKRFGLFKVLALLLVLVVGAGVVTVLWADSKLNRVEALADYDGRPSGGAGTNWLLVGTDSRAGLSSEDADRLMAGEIDDSAGRTDTIMLVHIPSFGGKAKIVSFPRDSLVDIPGYGENKINAAFSLGGAQLLQQTVEQSSGLRIDHYAEIGFGGFANLVDSVGGIEMCLDEPLTDPMAGIDLGAGCQELDGPNALGFVRSRYASAQGDLDRVDRQRQFLSAISKKLASPGTVINPFRLFPTIGSLADAITVDKSDHAWHLARLGLAIRNAEQLSVPTGGSIDTYSGNALLWDEQAAQELFKSMR